jgi:hypothetical protein
MARAPRPAVVALLLAAAVLPLCRAEDCVPPCVPADEGVDAVGGGILRHLVF